MICPSCFGTGYVKLRSHPENEEFDYPCEQCECRGVVHCCEGDQACDPPAPVHTAFDKREHVASIDCWCGPVEIEDGVYLHCMVV